MFSPQLMTLRASAVALLFAVAPTAIAASADESSFLAENQAAMARMMAGMSVAPSGDTDRDFALAMIAHHQGAIEMAQAELRHCRNEQLHRIAQEIIVEQQQEIVAMRLALGEPAPVSVPSSAHPRNTAPAYAGPPPGSHHSPKEGH